MPLPTPPRSRFWLGLVLLGPLSAAWADPPKVPCAGAYKPEYKEAYGVDAQEWKALCRPESRPAAKPSRKTTSVVPAASSDPLSVPAARGAQHAVEGGGNLNLLFDRSLARGDSTGAPAVQARESVAAPPVITGKIAFTRLDAGSVQDAPLDPKQVAAHFKYEPPNSWLSGLGFIGRAIDDYVVKPVRGALFGGPEKAYVKQMTDKLQESEEGRRIMRGVINEGAVVKITPKSFPGSRIEKHGNLEQIEGVRGVADTEDNVYHFNRIFMKMEDKESGLETASSNMGHELNHVLLHERVKKRLPEYDEVLDYALVDEQSARLKGYVVAWELNRGKPNGYIQDGRRVAANPEAFWEQMKTWSPAYERSLDLEEMKDPVASYKARAEGIKKMLADTGEEGDGLVYDLRRIDHMGQAHKAAEPLKELRAEVQGQKESLPEDIKELKESRDVVNERIAYLSSPKGKAFLEKMKKAARDPRFVQLFNDMQNDVSKLRGYEKSKPVPKPTPTPGAWDWNVFEARWEELHVDAPGKEPPWIEKNAPSTPLP